MACVVLLLSALVYAEVSSMGFPDGHLTELDRAERVLAYGLLGVNFFVSLWFVFLFRRAPHEPVGRRVWVSTALYAVFVAVMLAVDLGLSRHLDAGGGG